MPAPVMMFMNMKGGVGKTTLAVHLSYAYAYSYHKKVVLIDYDPQFSASSALLTAPNYFKYKDARKTICGLLTPSLQETDAFNSLSDNSLDADIQIENYAVNMRRWIYPDKTEAGRQDLVLGDIDMMRIALNTFDYRLEQKLMRRWTRIIQSCRERYDIVLIDCHPAGSFFTKSAIKATDLAVVPVTTDAFAVMGLNMMRIFLESQASSTDFAVVFNNPGGRWSTGIEDAIRTNPRFATHCINRRMEFSAVVANAPATKKIANEAKVNRCLYVTKMIGDIAEELVVRWQKAQPGKVMPWIRRQ